MTFTVVILMLNYFKAPGKNSQSAKYSNTISERIEVTNPRDFVVRTKRASFPEMCFSLSFPSVNNI